MLAIVPAGAGADFLAPLSLAVLEPSPTLAVALADVGIETCGDLARLAREAVEVRFGPEGVALWRLARADDTRRIFTPAPRTLPSASLAWEEYVLRDAEQLVFVANRLITVVCAELRSWGEAARALTLELTLADRTTVARPLRVARETANRAVWMRLVRREFDRLGLADGVAGLSVRVDAVGAAGVQQGDIFDRGFQTAQAVEDALERLEEDGQATVVEPVASAHPLPERRVRWQVREPGDPAASPWPGAPRLVLQLFPEPQRIDVVTARRRGRGVPVRFRTAERRDRDTELLTAIGPDHVSSGTETGAPYAREYFTCLTDNGLLILLFRDALADAWYLHGWWD